MKKIQLFSLLGALALFSYGIVNYKAYIESRIVINRPIDQVWQHFQCIEHYPKWNTLFYFEAFPTHEGQYITVDLYNDHAQVAITMHPQIISLRPYHLEWEGRIKFQGLFDGRHQFTFQALDAHSTELIHSEKFSGVFVPLLKYSIIQPTKKRFNTMNNSFKTFVESSPLTSTCKNQG